MSKIKNTKKLALQRWVIPTLILVLTGGAITGAYFFYKERQEKINTGHSSIRPGNNLAETLPGGAGTPEYNRTLHQYNKEESERADRQGKSFIPTVIGKEDAEKLISEAIILDEPEVPDPKEVQPPAPTMVPPPKPEAKAKAQAQADQEYQRALQILTKDITKAVGDELVMINKTMKLERPVQVSNVYKVDLEELKKPLLISSVQATLTKEGTPQETTPFEVGEVLYAVNEIAVNSDVPGPVVVQVIGGPLKGGKFIGKFIRHDDQLLLEFSKFSFNNNVIRIQGYAVDPSTSGVAVRSDADHHYLSRWGGLVAASFLEGFGDAVQYSGVSTYTQPLGGVVQQYPDYSLEDQAWIAAGRVGERLAVPMYQNFYRPPTVYLDSGTGIGVLIVSN